MELQDTVIKYNKTISDYQVLTNQLTARNNEAFALCAKTSRERTNIGKKNDELIKMYNALLKENKRLDEDLKGARQLLAGQIDAPFAIMAVTGSGKIDGHEVQIRGVVPRGGVRSNNPSGPCIICTRML